MSASVAGALDSKRESNYYRSRRNKLKYKIRIKKNYWNNVFVN